MTAWWGWALALATSMAPGAAIGSLPPIGLAVAVGDRAWCAEFRIDSASALARGTAVTLVFAQPATVPAWAARVRGPHDGECPAAFPQLRWHDYTAYALELERPVPESEMPVVALVVASAAPWARGRDGIVRGDLDGDGAPEEVRRCTADEGEHFTVWSARAGVGLVRRWHEYFDWGGLTEPTCGPGEDGREPSTIAGG